MARIVRLAAATVFGAMVAVTVPTFSLPLLSAAPTPAAGSTDEFRWQGRLAPGQVLEIKGINGSIVAGAASGDSVEIMAEKSGRRDNPADVRIDVIEHGGGITVCAVYPSGDSTPNTCQPGGGGRMRVDDNDVQVKFTVRVPADAPFVARTVNGGIEASGLTGRVDARTVNGSVDVRTAGPAEVETVNGSIKAAVGSTSWAGRLEFRTVNGSIEIGLPADVSARVLAETVNGQLESDFPLTIQGTFGPRRLEGTIGQGGRELRLKTVNGRIALRRAS